MLYFTKYADNKFDILNKHKIFVTKEQVEDTVISFDKQGKKGNLNISYKDNLAVVYEKSGDIIRILTFFPT